MSYPFGELVGWPGTYWLEKVDLSGKPEPPDLSNREILEGRVEEAKKEIRNLLSQKPPEKEKQKLSKFYLELEKLNIKYMDAQKELFQKITQPIAIYRAWRWKSCLEN